MPIDLRLIVAHGSIQLIHKRFLRVDLLLRDTAGGNQRRITVQIQPCIPQLGLVAEQLRLHLFHLHLEGASIDFDEQFSLVNVLPFRKFTFMICPSTRLLMLAVLNAVTDPSPDR